MTNDMRHMDHIEAVATRDVSTLRKKEETYQGSWKRRGGVGAFMMMARKWDRLESMLTEDGSSGENKAPPFDVFARIERDAAWEKKYSNSTESSRMAVDADGTVLAEIRDLRCYLTLVEAEMVARGAIAVRQQYSVREIDPHFAEVTSDGKVYHRPTERRVPRFESVNGPPLKDGDPEETFRSRTPEDGGQHAVLAPWMVDNAWFEAQEIDHNMRALFWRRMGVSDQFALETHVQSHHIPRPVSAVYELKPDAGWIIRVGICPEELRENYPRLPPEMNAKEHEEAPLWQRGLYYWNSTKFELSGTAQAWAREM